MLKQLRLKKRTLEKHLIDENVEITKLYKKWRVAYEDKYQFVKG